MKKAILVTIFSILPAIAMAEANRTVDCQVSITSYGGETLYENELSGIISPSNSWPLTQDLNVTIGNQQFILHFHMTYLFDGHYTYASLMDSSSSTFLASAGAETSGQSTQIHASGDNHSLMADGSSLHSWIRCGLGPVRK